MHHLQEIQIVDSHQKQNSTLVEEDLTQDTCTGMEIPPFVGNPSDKPEWLLAAQKLK